ncbi:MAG: hypothetical protein IJ830_02085 [Alphaproteobacteria bacterium]|nr:hypothetical protein [Alphaproteobacteria bacterium]
MSETINNKKTYSVLTALSVVLAYIGLGACFYQNHILMQKLENSRKIYFYDLQEVIRHTGIAEAKQKYEQDVISLNEDLLAAEKKIKSLKDAKVKEDFSEVYLKNLRLKRDELVENYEKSISELTGKINVALAEIAKEKDTSAIFVRDILVVKTPYVEDVTDDVIKHLKK